MFVIFSEQLQLLWERLRRFFQSWEGDVGLPLPNPRWGANGAPIGLGSVPLPSTAVR